MLRFEEFVADIAASGSLRGGERGIKHGGGRRFAEPEGSPESERRDPSDKREQNNKEEEARMNFCSLTVSGDGGALTGKRKEKNLGVSPHP